MKTWAENEIELAIKKQTSKEDFMDGYVKMCFESALEAYKVLCAQGHSGMSIHITQGILNRLIDGKPLTAIEDTPDVWTESRTEENGTKHFQCDRMPSLFKIVDENGNVSYDDIHRVVCKAVNNDNICYSSLLVSDVIDKMYPLEMPYFPADRSYVVLVEEANCYKHLISVTTPECEVVSINRYFDDKGEEISEEEFTNYKNTLE